jgi:predicted amidophosphoribosyltransferase
VAGYIPSVREQAEFARGFDRYIDELRATAYPEERFCEVCERPLASLERLCDECAADCR